MSDKARCAVYQIYPKSFQDTNGDGIGDLPGVTRRLDYIKGLGVDYIWLTPFFVSPGRDNGYDVADYRAIDPVYGTMADFEALVLKAESLGLGVMLDMVFNHTSTEHEWFQRALAGDEKYKDYYIWKKPVDGGMPTNWESKFGGPVWEYVPEFGEYYLHLFDRTQADLNWENPAVRAELRDVLHFWMDKGVKGFRFDVVNLISKPDVYENDGEGDGRRFYTDGPRVHEYLKELCAELNGRGILTVGEMSSTSIGQCVRYSRPEEKELSMCFSFHHLKVDYREGYKWALQPVDFMALKGILNDWQLGMQAGGGWNALFWSNHDQPRVLSRFGNDVDHPVESGKMLAAVMALMRGTPYIYQGEELGMTNAGFTEIGQYVDVESVNHHRLLLEQGLPEEEVMEILAARSRDNGRTPMQWDTGENAGFTAGTPWLAVNPNHTRINAGAALVDRDSLYHWYRALLRLRKTLDVVALGSYQPVLEEDGRVFGYLRRYEGQGLLVLANFFGEEATVEVVGLLPGGRYLLGNYGERQMAETIRLRPYEVLVFLG